MCLYGCKPSIVQVVSHSIEIDLGKCVLKQLLDKLLIRH